MDKSIFIDTSRCTACRGCQTACELWHRRPAEQAFSGSVLQNPQDLSFFTYKLVRSGEAGNGASVPGLFFPEQCRHCIVAPCKAVADSYMPGAILRDGSTGAVYFTELTRFLTAGQKQDVRDACPYNVPRWDPDSGLGSKCDMCVDRVRNGLLPSCVQICASGAMNFGDREDMLRLARDRLEAVRRRSPKARLLNPEDVNVIYLVEQDPGLYHKHAAAKAARPRTVPRREFLAGLPDPSKPRT